MSLTGKVLEAVVNQGRCTTRSVTDALDRNIPSNAVSVILDRLSNKGFRGKHLIKKIEKEDQKKLEWEPTETGEKITRIGYDKWNLRYGTAVSYNFHSNNKKIDLSKIKFKEE